MPGKPLKISEVLEAMRDCTVHLCLFVCLLVFYYLIDQYMWLLRNPFDLNTGILVVYSKAFILSSLCLHLLFWASFSSCAVLKIYRDIGMQKGCAAATTSPGSGGQLQSVGAQLALSWGLNVPSKAIHLCIRCYWGHCVMIITSAAETAGDSFLSQTPGMSCSQLTLSVCYVDIWHFWILKEILVFNQ